MISVINKPNGWDTVDCLLECVRVRVWHLDMHAGMTVISCSR